MFVVIHRSIKLNINILELKSKDLNVTNKGLVATKLQNMKLRVATMGQYCREKKCALLNDTSSK